MGAVLLLFVSAAWGSAFPLMKDLMIRMPVEDLLAERYGVAAVALFALRPHSLFRLPRATWTKGVLLGLMFGVGQTCQAVALSGLPASVSGFAVGCNVVMTPVLGLVLLGTRLPARTWLGVILAMAGVTVFTLLRGVEGSEISLLALGATLFAAALYSGHTLVLGRVAGPQEVYALTVIQLGTIGVMTGLLALPDGLTLPSGAGDWWIMVHLAVVSCALGFLARSLGQVYVAPVPAAILLSSQPLWVAALAATLYGEAITWSIVIGGGLTLAAMLLAVPAGDKTGSRTGDKAHTPPPTVAPAAEREEVVHRATQVLSTLLHARPDPGVPTAGGGSGPTLPHPTLPPEIPVPREGPSHGDVGPVVLHALAIVRARSPQGEIDPLPLREEPCRPDGETPLSDDLPEMTDPAVTDRNHPIAQGSMSEES
ncbi:DMT family transporter [Sinosporangium siamense]|nr:DMT family transporter [Sinosporangium siamense]